MIPERIASELTKSEQRSARLKAERVATKPPSLERNIRAVRLSAEEYAALVKAASNLGLTPSSYIRMSLRQQLGLATPTK